jgi:orotate phosphoribosyltransferase
MSNKQEEVINIFKESGALLSGHFLLRSGLHSAHFFQCAQVCQYMDKVTRLAELLVENLSDLDFTTVLAPAMGGLVIGQEVARQTNSRFIFVEKIDDKLEFRRGFKMESGEKILIVEDVITRGGRVNEALKIVEDNGGRTAGVSVLVDRSEGKADFGLPLVSLVQLSFPTYPADALPPELANTPATKPGS